MKPRLPKQAVTTTPKSSHKKNRPFDFKLIDLVEPHQILYKRQIGLSAYRIMKTKHCIWQQISEEMGATTDFCLKRWNNLRGQFQKELRYCRELCPKLGVVRGSTWPYLERMRFLEDTIRFNRPAQPERVSTRKRKTNETASSDDVNEENSTNVEKLFESIQETNSDDETPTTGAQLFENIIHCDDDFIEEIADDDIFNNKEEETEIPANELFVNQGTDSPTAQILVDRQPLTVPFEVKQMDNIFIDDDDNDCSINLFDDTYIEHKTKDTTYKKDTTDNKQQPKKLRQSSVDEQAEQKKRRRTIFVLFDSFENDIKLCVERRIMAFLCNCQLRVLHNQSIDDLNI